MTTIYELLHQDHEKVKSALDKILSSSDGSKATREKIFSEVRHDLELHTKFEEDEFYPRFREAKHDQEAKSEVKDALEEHAEAKNMLAEIAAMDTTSDEFLDKVETLKEALEHHISDEEKEMFPQARKALSNENAQEMGEHYEKMKSK